jgi:hypothetical protein
MSLLRRDNVLTNLTQRSCGDDAGPGIGTTDGVSAGSRYDQSRRDNQTGPMKRKTVRSNCENRSLDKDKRCEKGQSTSYRHPETGA